MKFQLTDLGKNLLSSLQAGERLIFTKAEASAEYSSSPQSLLSVQNKVQDIQIEGVQIDQESKRAKLKMTLTNIGLNSEYDLKQLGVYAKAAAGEEILYLVGQDSRGERIPAITDKEVEFDYSIWFNYDDAYEIIVSISGNDFLKKQEFITAVEDFESRKLDTDGGDISKTITTITEPTGTEAYPDILAAGGITETVIGKLVRWLKSLKADKVDVTDYENHTHDDRYYTENEVNTELDKKVTASGGNIADTKVGSITASTTSYPVPTAGDTVKVGFGKIIKFFGDVKNWMTGVCLIGSIVNNCVTNNAKLPLSAAQGKVLMDLYTVLNTKLAANETYTEADITSNIKTTYVQKTATTYAKYLKISKIVILCLYDFDVKATSAATSASIPILTGLPPARQAIPQQFRHGENTIRFIISGTSLNLHYCHANETVSVNDFIVYVTS